MLYQCGTAKPTLNVLGGKVFQIPLIRVAVPDTVPYAFLVRYPRSSLHCTAMQSNAPSERACSDLSIHHEGVLLRCIHLQ